MKRLICILILAYALPLLGQRSPDANPPLRYTLEYQGQEREYFVRLPENFDPEKTYWPLVAVHGGQGNAKRYSQAKEIQDQAEPAGLDVIVIVPQFLKGAPVSYPDAGEGAFLKELLNDIRSNYKLHEKLLITGYSAGGAFTLRFAMQNPGMILAAAPCSPGSITTPGGDFMNFRLDPPEIMHEDVERTLSSERFASSEDEQIKALVSVAKFAGLPHKRGANRIPFLVMCGLQDPRRPQVETFVNSLQDAGYRVEAAWPDTAHGMTKATMEEFKKYTPTAIAFFQRETQRFLDATTQVRQSLQYEGEEREYYVGLPRGFDPDSVYWPLVFVHGSGGSGSGNGMGGDIRRLVRERQLPIIVISPTFKAAAFPIQGEGNFLKEVMKDLRSRFRLRERILLTGYSMGGQFTHRFAMGNPEWVEAAAPCSAGAWTTPEGNYFNFRVTPPVIPHADVERILASQTADDQEAASVAGLPAKPGAERIPFLVMCGTLDPRLDQTERFVESLVRQGYSVETAWPVTPHLGGSTPEKEKYGARIVDFFARIIENK